jgi:hypothetical protein
MMDFHCRGIWRLGGNTFTCFFLDESDYADERRVVKGLQFDVELEAGHTHYPRYNSHEPSLHKSLIHHFLKTEAYPVG